MAMHHDKMPTPVGQGVYMDERLDALLSITGRMDGYLYRCRNDASYTMLYISDGMLTVSGYPPSDFIHNQVRDYVSAIHPDDLPPVYAAVDAALEARCNWNVDYRIVPLMGEPPSGSARSAAAFSTKPANSNSSKASSSTSATARSSRTSTPSCLQELKAANEELSAQKREIELAKQQSDHSANHDLLTGLPNRRAFHNELNAMINRANSDGTAIGLLFIDLDRFKEVNDTLGHEAGDALLEKVAVQLRSTCGAAISWPGWAATNLPSCCAATSPMGATGPCASPSASWTSCEIRVPCPGGVIQVGCTIGVAVYPEDAVDSDRLMAVADRLMYVGKKNGRNRMVMADELHKETQLPLKANFRRI